MNGAHDLGGMHGFGPVAAEPDEPVFHADWERRIFALTLAMGAWRRWNLDMSRSAREQMPPGDYLSTSYYEHWLFGLQRQLAESGLVDADELRMVQSAPATVPAPAEPIRIEDGAVRAGGVQAVLRRRIGARRADPVAPRLEAGQPVRARNTHPVGHTRLPRYVRGRCGTIDRDHGVFVFPDSNAAGQGSNPQHVYSVRFAARELWGSEASARDGVYVDLWDDYLEPA
jgi:nitrile hydratase